MLKQIFHAYTVKVLVATLKQLFICFRCLLVFFHKDRIWLLQVESKRKHASQSIPLSILRRVRELAVIYPYPRERKTQLSQTEPVVSPIPATTCDNLVPVNCR
uniref:Uncharacterized protein n=1 Tax=Davidia involucrata TaxID=16924 RepID=A0A5B7BX62_DAVIN